MIVLLATFSLGFFIGLFAYMLGVISERHRQEDRRLLEEQNWCNHEHYHIINDPEPWGLKSPSCGKDNW